MNWTARRSFFYSSFRLDFFVPHFTPLFFFFFLDFYVGVISPKFTDTRMYIFLPKYNLVACLHVCSSFHLCGPPCQQVLRQPFASQDPKVQILRKSNVFVDLTNPEKPVNKEDNICCYILKS